MTVHDVRAVADAVLYEGYLLYPYRSTSAKNQSRWQFGVLGPEGAARAGLGEESSLSAQCPVRGGDRASLTLAVRFLQLQHRQVRDAGSTPVDDLVLDGQLYVTWDEAVAHDLPIGPLEVSQLLRENIVRSIDVPAAEETEELPGGTLVRTRAALHGRVTVFARRDGDAIVLTVSVTNVGAPPIDRDAAIARSFIGAHVIIELDAGSFTSLIDPPAAAIAERCLHHRVFPVLAGSPDTDHVMLLSPIILYDHPEVAAQSEVALFDATEIDEILTLRVLTMTDEEKAQARATDARAAEILDRCESMSPDALARLHGVRRDPADVATPSSRTAADPAARLVPEIPDGVDWWEPQADDAVEPESDAVLVDGVTVSRGSRVRLRPSRRADAHDLFFAGMAARVMTVHADVDGQTHVGVVIEDDPAADLHESYGRYFYFAPDEVEPLDSR
ncbi:hypothetical protein [Gordonia sp. SL306]|uniref:hypothetical protein n=1 Tax=Gordonia sp. SL306 TaxID=2995145 RepID=UPI00226E9E00|nr:hypothetical protein [Gordonia sp. SL306]WAC53714.1 hypothetical protein OVA31_13410 [Gordonia sp. SL306]